MSQKRAIFEEVGEATGRQEMPRTGLIDGAAAGARAAVRGWLIVLFVMVATMIAVGGLTRLTDSGLSITEWKPISGALPPLSAEAWQHEFDLYRLTPEYLLQNKGMDLAEFKYIFWWEWGHRQLGRLVGLVWAAGFAYFALTRKMPRGWSGRLFGIGALGALQGAVGWWMVSSGLAPKMLDVASYRLAIHLGIAFVILGLIAGYVLRLSRSEAELLQARRGGDASLTRLTGWLVGLAFVQILLGALVAGIDAGRGFTDWPLMAGRFFPEGAFAIEPLWRNFFENDGLVQFVHRMVAYLLLVAGLWVWWRSRSNGTATTRRAFDWMAVMLFGQAVLGIGTVLYSAPLQIAIIHQVGAVALWVLVIRARFHARYPVAQTLRGAAR